MLRRYTVVRFVLTALICAGSGATVAFGQGAPSGGAALQKITINYPARTGTTWPLYIAKEGGYYEKYGLDTNLVFGVHPAGIAMLIIGQLPLLSARLRRGRATASSCRRTG